MIQPAAWIGEPGLTLAHSAPRGRALLGPPRTTGGAAALAAWIVFGVVRSSAPPRRRRDSMPCWCRGMSRRARNGTAPWRSPLRALPDADGERRRRGRPGPQGRGLARDRQPVPARERRPGARSDRRAPQGAAPRWWAACASVRTASRATASSRSCRTGPSAAYTTNGTWSRSGNFSRTGFRVPVQVVPGGGFAGGPGPETLHLPGLPPAGPLICYEAVYPGEMVDEADRPAWLVNITNDAWFGFSTGPRQHLAAARMRAVEEGLPLMRAANTGIFGRLRRTGVTNWADLVSECPVSGPPGSGSLARLHLRAGGCGSPGC